MGVKVDVEYCGVCNFEKQCTDLAATINTMCPDAEVTCNKGRRGSFEVRINDVLVHSKLANMAFPVNEDVGNNVIKAKDGQPLTKVKEQPITDCVIQ
ncbi:hypothetical protein HA402_002328 [Bradysia odoriphaga]|nr:hypothetical protein HA402_002328 [Bradysia odoriphaga]